MKTRVRLVLPSSILPAFNRRRKGQEPYVTAGQTRISPLAVKCPAPVKHRTPGLHPEWISTWWGREGEGGVLRLPFGNGRHAPVAAADQAHVIAAILQNPEPHDRQAYPLHGPAEMDHYGIAAAVSRALGIPVSYQPVSIDEFAAGLASLGRSPHMIQHLSNVAIDYQNGIFQGTNNLIEVIGDHTPMTVEEFVTSRKHDFDQNGPNHVLPKPI